MSIIDMGRSLLRLQYQAASLPLRIVERQIVGRYLGKDSTVHLALERVVAALDLTAGRLLSDEVLRAQGGRTFDHSDALGRAVRLEKEAERGRTEAARRERAESRAAAKQRAAARETQRDRVAAAVRDEKVDQKRVNARAEKKAKDDKRAADARAEQRQHRAKAKQQEEEKRTDARTERAAAGPKRELKAAARDKADARREQDGAEQLAKLADKEQSSA